MIYTWLNTEHWTLKVTLLLCIKFLVMLKGLYDDEINTHYECNSDLL